MGMAAMLFKNAAAGGGGGLGYDATILAETSLVHYWKLGEAAASGTIADSKGALSGTVGSAVTLGSTGIFSDGSTSAFFPGLTVNSFISMASLWGSNANWTYEWQMKHTMTSDSDFQGHPPLLMSNGDEFAAFNRIGLDASGNATAAAIDNYNSSGGQQGALTIARNTSYLLQITWDGTNLKFYYNGSLVTTIVSPTIAAPASGGSGVLGIIGSGYRFTGTPMYFMQGYMSKVAYYNAALTSTQVTAHYAARNTA